MRAFVAVDISEKGLLESIMEFQARAGINGRPVKPENLHFTLQFLGEIAPEAADGVVRAIQGIRFERFAVKFRSVGAFPDARRPRVIWIGTDDVGGAGMHKLVRQTAESLRPLGFATDGHFVPHITIQRTKRGADVADIMEKFRFAEFGTQEVRTIKLKQSVLTPEGPIYSDLGAVEAA